MSRRSKDVMKHTFSLIFIDVLETNFYERLSPKRINEYLIRKARRQQLNDQMGPLKLSVFEDHLELTKNLWWPNGTNGYLPYTQLRDVFPLEFEGKKLALGVANERTRQRRVLVFKAKSARECEQLVDILQNYRQFQQAYESETMRSASRFDHDSKQSVKIESPTSPYCRPMSAVSFIRSTSVTDCSQPTLQPEPRRSRYQSMERVSFAEATRDAMQQQQQYQRQQSPQRFTQYTHAYSDGQYSTKQRGQRLHRAPMNGSIDEYQRSASAVPVETYKILVPKPPSRPSKVERSVMQYTQARRTPTVSNSYMHQPGLPRSNSIQNLIYPTNDAVDFELKSPSIKDSCLDTTSEKAGNQKNSIHIHIQTSPRDTLTNGKSSAPPPQTRATSPTRPPEYESIIKGERFNGELKQKSSQRSHPPVTIVRELSDDQNSASDLLTLHRAANRLTRFVKVPSFSRPPLPPKVPNLTTNSGRKQNQEEYVEREFKHFNIYRETEIPVKPATATYTTKVVKEKSHDKYYNPEQYVTEIAIEPNRFRTEYHSMTNNTVSTLNTHGGSQSSLDDSDRSSYIDEHVPNELCQVPLNPMGDVRIKLNNYTLRKRDTAECSERGSRTLYTTQKKSTQTP